jgi:hypothetical protein
MKNLWFVALASTLLLSCSEKISKHHSKKHKIHNLVKKSSDKPAKEYENQDGYFDDIFNKDGNTRTTKKLAKPLGMDLIFMVKKLLMAKFSMLTA